MTARRYVDARRPAHPPRRSCCCSAASPAPCAPPACRSRRTATAAFLAAAAEVGVDDRAAPLLGRPRHAVRDPDHLRPLRPGLRGVVRGQAGPRRSANPDQRPRGHRVAEPVRRRRGDGSEPEERRGRRLAGRGQRDRGAAAPRRRRARRAGARARLRLLLARAATCACPAPVRAPPAHARRGELDVAPDAARGAAPRRRARPAAAPPRSPQPRRVVLLVDVSGSMAPYADALLRLAHASPAPASARARPGRGVHHRHPADPGHRGRCAARRRAGAAWPPGSRCPTGPAAPGSARCCAPSSTAGGSAGWPAVRSSWSAQRRLGARRPRAARRADAAAAPARPPGGLGQPAPRQGGLPAGAAGDRRRAAARRRLRGRALARRPSRS